MAIAISNTNLPWQGDSEKIFCLRIKLPPVYGGGFTLFLFVSERESRKQRTPIFIVFRLTRLEIKFAPTVSVMEALSTRPPIGRNMAD